MISGTGRSTTLTIPPLEMQAFLVATPPAGRPLGLSSSLSLVRGRGPAFGVFAAQPNHDGQQKRSFFGKVWREQPAAPL